jgi:hypothetical protein
MLVFACGSMVHRFHLCFVFSLAERKSETKEEEKYRYE